MGELNTFDDRSVKKIADTVAYVEDITQKQAAGQRQFGDNDFKVKLTSETVTPGEWNASEVVWDGSAFVIPTDAETWDTTTPLIVTGSAGAVDDILTAESLADTSSETVWLAIKPSGGGGDTKVRLKVKATVTVAVGITFLCDIIDNAGTVLTVDVSVSQKKFTSAKFYINEIIYGDVDGIYYLADAYLAGIGVG
jgi:hypothetical protein